MAPDISHPNLADRFRLSTEQFAAQQLVEPQTVRKRYAANGSYHGVKPLRLPNRKLLWPCDTIEHLLAETYQETDDGSAR